MNDDHATFSKAKVLLYQIAMDKNYAMVLLMMLFIGSQYMFIGYLLLKIDRQGQEVQATPTMEERVDVRCEHGHPVDIRTNERVSADTIGARKVVLHPDEGLNRCVLELESLGVDDLLLGVSEEVLPGPDRRGRP